MEIVHVHAIEGEGKHNLYTVFSTVYKPDPTQAVWHNQNMKLLLSKSFNDGNKLEKPTSSET